MEVRRNLKLSAKFYGLYKIVERVGTIAYRLELPPGSRIHPVFHVSQLKRHIGTSVVSQQPPPTCDAEGSILVEPIAIIKRRLIKLNSVKVLVQWSNMSPAEATSEDWSYIRSRFPQFVARS